MKSPFMIENIEGVRRKEGIVDAALKAEVKTLGAGDRVKLSLSIDEKTFETLTVRITSVREMNFRGKLVKKPKSQALRPLDVDSSLTFEAGHIHSIVSRNSALRMKTQVEEEVDAAPKIRSTEPTRSAVIRMASTQAASARAALAMRPTASNRTKSGKKRSLRLRIEGDAKRRFIQVPIDRANELHSFLREKRVRSSPPQPYYSDCNCIELDRNVDIEGLEKLLKTWR